MADHSYRSQSMSNTIHVEYHPAWALAIFMTRFYDLGDWHTDTTTSRQ